MSQLFARCDFHVHTSFSPCGESEMVPSEIMDVAEYRGIQYLGITDHLHENTDLNALLAIRDEFPTLNGVRLFYGCEADVDSVGVTYATPEIASKLDYVMVAPTHFQHGYGTQPPSYDPDVIADYMLEMFEYAVTLEFADVVAHPFMIPPYPHYSTISQDLLTNDRLKPSLEVAKKNGIAMEISRRSLVPGQQIFFTRFYKLCKQIGLKFSIGSDAHSLKDLGQTYILEPLIMAVGITDEDLWLPGR